MWQLTQELPLEPCEWCECAAEAVCEQCVLSEWRAIEHLPQPDRRLALRVELRVDVGVVLRLGGDVAWIEIVKCRAGCETRVFARGLIAAVIDVE